MNVKFNLLLSEVEMTTPAEGDTSLLHLFPFDPPDTVTPELYLTTSRKREDREVNSDM